MSNLDDNKVKILLVDDQEDGLLALDAVLAPLGQHLVRAKSGREALRCILRDSFALILLDVVMPEMDGFEIARIIRERPATRDTPIIFLTALSNGEMPAFRAYSLGAVDYILKPIEPNILRSKVSVFVDLERRNQQLRQQEVTLREAQRRDHENGLREALLRKEVEVSTNERQWMEALLNVLPIPRVLFAPGQTIPIFENRAARNLPWTFPMVDSRAVQFRDATGNVLSPNELPDARARTGETIDGQLLFWQSATREGAVQIHAETLPPMWGHEATVAISFDDITELARTQRSLQEAVVARESFISVAAHELKTPLTALALQLQSLAQSCRNGAAPTVEKVRDATDHLERSTSRLTRLIDDLLDVTRIVSGQLEFERADVDLSEVVRASVDEMGGDFERAKCLLQLNIAPGIVGYWDRYRLEQVVQNLTSNAVKYGAGKPIEIMVLEEDGWACLTVRDHGIGIAQEDLGRIFHRFERVANKNVGGLGLGLWIVDQIVRGLGGSVNVESTPQNGSVFTARLPRSARTTSEQIATAA